jgi:hypothetical protein
MQTMSALDSLFLHFENDVSHMHLGAVALFEGPAPTAGTFAEVLAGKLLLLPRYRQRVRWVPWGLGRPMWVEDPDFELSYHLRHTALPRPGDAAQLRRLVGRVMAQPLDRRRPLWEMWLIEGASEGRWGLICKLHHCMVDGISAGDLLAVLLDPQPRTPASAPDRWQPSPEPSSASVLAHTLSETASGPARHLRAARALLVAPRDTARQAITLAAGLSSLRGLIGASTARSLNGPLRAERQWVQARASLADVKTIRRALGGTVNDVLLAAVSGDFRALLLSRGEPLPPELMVRTLVPLSLRTQDARGTPTTACRCCSPSYPSACRTPSSACTRSRSRWTRSSAQDRPSPAARSPSSRAWRHPRWSHSAPAPWRACLNDASRPSPPTSPAPSSRSTCAAGGCSRSSPTSRSPSTFASASRSAPTTAPWVLASPATASTQPTSPPSQTASNTNSPNYSRPSHTNPPADPRAPQAPIDPRRARFAHQLTRSRSSATRPRG